MTEKARSPAEDLIDQMLESLSDSQRATLLVVLRGEEENGAEGSSWNWLSRKGANRRVLSDLVRAGLVREHWDPKKYRLPTFTLTDAGHRALGARLGESVSAMSRTTAT